MTCQFCDQDGVDRGDGVSVCASCWNLLKDPVTALPLIRGTVTAELRGSAPKEKVDRMVNKFMEMVSNWRRPG